MASEIRVTNIKANDGTASLTVADSTGAVTTGQNLAVGGTLTSTGAISTDSITELTSANGVSIDGLKIKDYSLMYGSNIGLTVSSDGYVTNPNQPFFCGRGRSGTLSFSGNYRSVLFTGNIISNGIVQNTSTGKCSIPIAGKYRISFTNGNTTSPNNNQYMGLAIYKNTTQEAQGWSRNEGYDKTAHCELILDLSTSDTIAFCYEGQYAAPPTGTVFTSATITLIG